MRVGQVLYIPNGSIPKPVSPVTTTKIVTRPSVYLGGSGLLGWPVPKIISQYFSWFHPAIDIAPPYGTPIYAAASGTIIEAKKVNYSFGWYCIEDIGNGYTVAYAHMSDQACYVGQYVTRGQYIGAVGTTGRATGPHLHLEVRHNGTAVDPLTLLP
jgi:murein DD-endopeptidase MepM/ murein hydrolase activator NlpD